MVISYQFACKKSLKINILYHKKIFTHLFDWFAVKATSLYLCLDETLQVLRTHRNLVTKTDEVMHEEFR